MTKRAQAIHTMGVDPGCTTGYAVLGPGGDVEMLGDLSSVDVLEGLDEVAREINRRNWTLECAVELLAPTRGGDLAAELRYVETAVRKVLAGVYDYPIIEVFPVTWKPHRSTAGPVPITRWYGTRLSRHQRDAINIARWRAATRPAGLRLPARMVVERPWRSTLAGRVWTDDPDER